jgi:predicted CoA-substrate-specific enzyme activase
VVEGTFFVGIDAGSTVCKAVAINSSGISESAMAPILGNPESAMTNCIKTISYKSKMKPKLLKKYAVVSGLNSDKITIEEKEPEVTCIGRGAFDLNSNIRLVIDVGSFSMKALRIDSKGNVKDFMMNNKCAGGSGILLELVAEALELEVSALAEKAFESKNPIPISSQCSIFAESEVISYKNEGANITDLIAGVCNSVAGRMYPLVHRLDKNPKNLAFTGGVAKNKKIVQNLEERLNLKLIDLGLDPQFITAYGAAIIAKANREEFK